LGRRRLPTSADQIRRTGTPIERRHPCPYRSARPSRDLSSPTFVQCPCFAISHSTRDIHGKPTGFGRRRKPSFHRRGRSQEPNRADRAERRTRALREFPSSCLCRTPRGRQPVAAKDLECPPPRLTCSLLLRASPPFEGQEQAWLACWPRLSFPRPPAKEDVFRRVVVLSTVSSSFWVRGDRSSRPLGLGLFVTPPCLRPRFARTRHISLHQSGIAARSTSAFLSTPLAPKP